MNKEEKHYWLEEIRKAREERNLDRENEIWDILLSKSKDKDL